MGAGKSQGWIRGVSWKGRRVAAVAATSSLALLALPMAAQAGAPVDGPTQSVIVEFGHSSAEAAHLLKALAPDAHGRADFSSVPGVAADLPPGRIAALEALGANVVADTPITMQAGSYKNSNVTCPGPTDPSTASGQFPKDTGSKLLSQQTGNTGAGVTVAVLDTGINASLPDLAGTVIDGVDLTGNNSPYTDEYGHGTFVAGLIAGNGASSNGQYVGEAPGAKLVSIKAAGASGVTSASTVIQGIDWAIAHQLLDNIRVLNLSLGGLPTGPTATEPIDQAVEAAWNAGIVVVVSAGNSGPFNGTILSPGDDPLAITAGAYADNNSSNPNNWAMCPFSSVGPTEYDGWFKPDLVAPGRSVISVADPGSTVYNANPSARVGTGNFVGSGTSFSAAITSGSAALVIAAHPASTPDRVKGRLLGNAMPAPVGNPFVEGHGMINAYYAAQGPDLVDNQGAAAAAELVPSGPTVNLGSSWNGSSWNGSSWNGSSWNGSSWNGSSWNGSSWNGSSWNGFSFSGSSWNGSSWNGSSWNGSSWNNMVWDGSSWNGSSWNGSSWNGGSWTGSSWNGSSWNGSSWNGSSWNGGSWTGGSWTGSSWNGSSWNGSSWNGGSWTGGSWTGGSWTGGSWT